MFSCLSFLRISISCLRLCISLSVFPCLRMNFIATVWRVYLRLPL
uniref:Uncharacterized protein n=1 Tax=Arundo donax TaxID=35708 RepID=A0A0A9E3J8_ARUDO